jgi:hypothetical protein
LFAAVTVTLAALVVASSPAGSTAWAGGNEAHLVQDEVRVVLSAEGRAEVSHAEQWHVSAGTLRSFDVVGIEEHADLRPEVTVEGTDGSRSSAHVAWFAPRVARVTLDEPHGLRRGDYRLEISYGVDLLSSHELTSDGALWRLAWTAPAATEGTDGAIVSFDLPAAPTAPRADMGGSSGDEGIVATVERGAARDRLQLVRPHVARGEAVTWAIRLDPRSLSGVPDAASPDKARLEAASAASLSSTERTWRRALEGLGLAAVAALYGWAARRRQGRGLVPLSPRVRGVGSGVALGLGLALQGSGSMTAGALALAACIVLCTLAPSPQPASVRGPGSWVAISPREAFTRTARTRDELRRLLAGIAAFLVLGLALAGASAPSLSRPLAIAALDLLVLVPLLVGGGIAATAFARSRRPLARAFRALSRRAAAHQLRVVPWARTPAGRTQHEELRLRLEPQRRIPGAIGVELGLVTTPGAASRPEVLVRVQATSPAALKIAALAPWAASLPGVTPDERVIRLSPRWPSLRLARKLTERVALALADTRDHGRDAAAAGARRAPANLWTGPERRARSISVEPSPTAPSLAPERMAPSGPAVDPAFLLLR